MQARELMSRNVKIVSPDDTVQKAAKLMAVIDAGILPVGENDRLVGCITDRDIAVRVVAEGKSPGQCTVREVMSPGIRYVYDEESDEEVAEAMSRFQLRRLPVISRDKKLVGIVSLADLATKCGGAPSEQAIRKVSQPAPH